MACKVFSTFFLVCFITSISFAQTEIKPDSKSETIKTEKNEIDHAANKERLMKQFKTKELSQEQLDAKRSKAIVKIAKGNKSKKTYSILTGFYYQCEFMFDGKEIKKANGQWYKFNDDFTYEYGVFDENKGKGKYYFDLDKMELTILDNNKKMLPELFDAKFKDDIMLWVAKDEYKNNPKQIKMTQKFAKPSNVVN